MNSLSQASRALQIGIRHLLLYVPLLRGAALEYRQSLFRRVVMLLLGACVALSAAMVGAVWLVMSLWTLEFRHWLIAAVVVIMLTASLALIRASTARRVAGPHGKKLHLELAQDHALIRDWQGDGDERKQS